MLLPRPAGVKCWGDGGSGELGSGTNFSLTPVDVIGLTNGVTAISAGWNITCALTLTGGVKCCGWNWNGQLGFQTPTAAGWTPEYASGLTSGVTAISTGGLHTCVLTSLGGMKCWGLNDHGQLGDGTTNDSFSPVDVVGFGP